jgi:hypothetical protein
MTDDPRKLAEALSPVLRERQFTVAMARIAFLLDHGLQEEADCLACDVANALKKRLHGSGYTFDLTLANWILDTAENLVAQQRAAGGPQPVVIREERIAMPSRIDGLIVIDAASFGVLSTEQQNRLDEIFHRHKLMGTLNLHEVLRGAGLPTDLTEAIATVVFDYPPFIEMRREVFDLIAEGPGDWGHWEYSHPTWEGQTAPPDDPDRAWTLEEMQAFEAHNALMRTKAMGLALRYRKLGYGFGEQPRGSNQ